jgi:TolB-like protein
MADIFVSYARSDKAIVTPLIAALEAQDWSVWWDSAIVPGQEFDRLIEAELARSKAVLVIWTANSVGSRWVRGEARAGADRGILVPVRMGNVELPIDFRAIHSISLDAGTRTSSSAEFAEVLNALGALIHKPPSTAASPALKAAAGQTAGSSAQIGICVLPFTDLGNDPQQAYFSDGISGDIITELSRWRMLTVRSRSASFRYRGEQVDPMQVARELDVRYVIEGNVRRLGDRIRISVQLIDGETGSQLWGEKFDRDQSEIFTVQDQVVQTIAATLVGRVQMTLAERARRKPPASLAAYECVQRGNALPWDNPEAAVEAMQLFEQAIALDPGYAIAYGLLGTMYIGQYRNDPKGSNAALDKAYALTQRAVELDDSDSTCHSLLAHACLYRRSYELALRHMRRSIAINPNNAWNRADMGLVLCYAGLAEEALSWLNQAREIDPYFDPPWYWRQTGQVYMVLRRFDEALAMFANIPLRTFRSCAYIAACNAQLGNQPQAQLLVSECLAFRPDFSVQQFMSKEPFKNETDADFLAESLRLAGLPE